MRRLRSASTMTSDGHFGIDVSFCSKTCKNIDFIFKRIHLACLSVLKMFIFQSKMHCFSICSKPPPGTVFRGSPCRSLLESWIVVPFVIFRFFKKAPFGHHFLPKSFQRRGTSSWWKRPCRDPAFHETIVITVLLGPTFFKGLYLARD